MNETASTPICLSCKHAIFDERFGEYKCAYREIYIYDAFVKTGCEFYEKGEYTPGQTGVDKPKEKGCAQCAKTEVELDKILDIQEKLIHG